MAVRWSSSCWVASPCLDSGDGALQVLLGVVEAGLVLRQLGRSPDRGLALNGAGSICTSRSPSFTICPSSKATFSIWPSTRDRTVTVLVACTVPSPFRTSGNGIFSTAPTCTGTSAGAGTRTAVSAEAS